MKRSLIAALALTLAFSLTLTLAGCGGGGTPAADSGAGGETGGSSADPTSSAREPLATTEEFAAALDADYADAEWHDDIVSITLETYLGTPVIAVNVAWGIGEQDWEANNRKQRAITEAVGLYDISAAPNVVLKEASGTMWLLISSGQYTGAEPMDIALDLPPAPQTADEVRDWLATVYGPGGIVTLGPDETWYDSIESIAIENWGSGSESVLVVKNSIPTMPSEAASLLERALQSTASPLLESYSLRMADGTGSSGSFGGAGTMAPGAGGFFYVTQ